MRYLMGIDNGGTFSKAAIFTEEGKQIAAASVPTVTITPRPGYTERDMRELWEVNAQAIRECILHSGLEPSQIVGVSLSGHGKGLYLVGQDGQPSYHGIVSTDVRAWEYAEKWKKDGTADKIRRISYQTVLACQPVSLLAWFRDHKPEVLEQTKYIFHVKDYIRFMLTGEAFGEYTDSTGGNLVNLNTKAYDVELLRCFGLESIMDKLPPLRYSDEVCGHITKEASVKTLLPEGIPVAAGMFDVDACGLASGLVSENEMCMIAGTWSINEFLAREPIYNNSVALNSMFCIPGYYLVEESSPTSAGNLEWFINSFLELEKKEIKQAGGSVYDVTNEWAASVDPRECNVIFLPFIHGSNENPVAKGTFIGLTAYHTKKHMLRAVYEGIVFSHLTHVHKLLKNRRKPDSLRLSGGASNSDVWVQIFADVMQIPIDVIEDKEIGAQGAAIVAGIAAGVYENYEDAVRRTVKVTKTVMPRTEYQEVYEEKYHTYRTIIEALEEGGAWNCFKN